MMCADLSRKIAAPAYSPFRKSGLFVIVGLVLLIEIDFVFRWPNLIATPIWKHYAEPRQARTNPPYNLNAQMLCRMKAQVMNE